MVGISDRRVEMLQSSRISIFLLHSSNPSYSFPWQAVCRESPSSMATFHPLGKMVLCTVTAWLIVWRHHPCRWLHPIPLYENGPMRCHCIANHLGGSRSYWNRILHPFASVTNAQHSRVWSSSQSFNHWILLRIPQTRFRPSGFSWMPPSVLAYTTKIPVKESKRYPPNLR